MVPIPTRLEFYILLALLVTVFVRLVFEVAPDTYPKTLIICTYVPIFKDDGLQDVAKRNPILIGMTANSGYFYNNTEDVVLQRGLAKIFPSNVGYVVC